MSPTSDERPERVWYVAYGSNVNRARFLRYLEGDDSHAGARDPAPPADDRWAVAPLRLCFANRSRRWGGGVCFVEPDPEGSTHVRAWDITAEQFEDVFAQENRSTGDVSLDWAAVAKGEPTVVGNGWYGRVLPIELPMATPDHPAVTFTWAERMPHNPPATAYRDTIADGLADHPGLSPAAIRSYLDAASGVVED